uniref:Uncharacterized protein n=1 Tax=Parascaris univalens TaxID=6257 RepID=A0A915AVQ7_PARUN
MPFLIECAAEAMKLSAQRHWNCRHRFFFGCTLEENPVDKLIEQRDELIKLIDSALNETIDRCSRLRTSQFIASGLRKQVTALHRLGSGADVCVWVGLTCEWACVWLGVIRVLVCSSLGGLQSYRESVGGDVLNYDGECVGCGGAAFYVALLPVSNAISHRKSDVLSISDTTLGHEMVCQRKDAVLIECAAGSDETFGTKTLGTQTSDITRGSDRNWKKKLKVWKSKAVVTNCLEGLRGERATRDRVIDVQSHANADVVVLSTRAVHDYDTEVSCQVAESTGIPPVIRFGVSF